MHQRSYILSLAQIPVPASAKKDDLVPNITPFQSLVGKLNWIGLTRPDAAFSTNALSRVMREPRWADVIDANKVVRRLQHVPYLPLRFFAIPDPELVVFADASNTTSGYLIFVRCKKTRVVSLLDWGCKKQVRIASSSLGKEVLAVSVACLKSIFVQGLLIELNYIKKDVPIKEKSDSKSLVDTTHTTKSKEKHLLGDIARLRQYKNANIVDLSHISAELNLADILTKEKPVCPVALLHSTIVKNAFPKEIEDVL